MISLLSHLQWLCNELGLTSVYATGSDAWLIILARSGRMFAYGANSLIIALFFSALEFTDFQIGLFMSLTLLGDVVLSLLLTLLADRLGRRRILFMGSLLMVISGTVFALFENFWILLFAAVVGVISATGGDFGPFRAIEESTLSHITTPKTRADVLAWYVTSSSLVSAIGTEFSGRAIDFIQSRDGWTVVNAYHSIFWLYLIMGALNMVLILFLSSRCEIEKEPAKGPEIDASEALLEEGRRKSVDSEDDEDERDGHLQPVSIEEPEKPKKGLFAQISRETFSVMSKICLLLIVDSLADGMTSYSLTNYYMDQKFHLAKSTLGDITSISYFLASLSTMFAGTFVRHLGLVKTMVFTHLPSSAAVLLFPIPQNVPLTILLFFIRTGLNNLDQAPRSALIAAVVKPEERTAVMGIVSMVRTLASAVGPSITGIFAERSLFWLAFVLAGTLRIIYDIGLFVACINMKLYQHERNDNNDKQDDPSQMSIEEPRQA